MGRKLLIPISNSTFKSRYNLYLQELMAFSLSYEELWNQLIVLI